MTIIPFDGAELALSHLLMSLIISPDNHSPVKPEPSAKFTNNGDESDSYINDIEDTKSNFYKSL